jgi:hypothetical protein
MNLWRLSCAIVFRKFTDYKYLLWHCDSASQSDIDTGSHQAPNHSDQKLHYFA